MFIVNFYVQMGTNRLGIDDVGDDSDINSLGLNLGFASTGLGIFDAFFTSLSMILVSEVQIYFPFTLVFLLYKLFCTSLDSGFSALLNIL